MDYKFSFVYRGCIFMNRNLRNERFKRYKYETAMCLYWYAFKQSARSRYFPFGILICLRFHKLLKQVAAVCDVGRWILFQYLIVFVPSRRHLTPVESVPYISRPTLSICKAFQSYNFTKTLKTLQTFPRKPRAQKTQRRKRRK